MKFAKVGKTAHAFVVNEGDGGTLVVTSLCGVNRGFGVEGHEQPPAKTKLCQTCKEKGMKLREEMAKQSPPPERWFCKVLGTAHSFLLGQDGMLSHSVCSKALHSGSHYRESDIPPTWIHCLCAECEKAWKKKPQFPTLNPDYMTEPKPGSDLAHYGVLVGDVWDTESGTSRFRVLKVAENWSPDWGRALIQWLSGGGFGDGDSAERLWQRKDEGWFHKLLKRGGTSVKPRVVEPELVPAVCDLWEREDGKRFIVEHVDRKDGKPDTVHIVYTKDNKRTRVYWNDPERSVWFRRLLRRSGSEKADEIRLKKPTRGQNSDASLPRIGDVWEGMAGERSKVLSVWWEREIPADHERVYVQDVDSRFYHYCASSCLRLEKLVERDGKPVEPKPAPEPAHGFTIRSTVEGDIWDPQSQRWSRCKKVFSHSMEGGLQEATEPKPETSDLSAHGTRDGDVWEDDGGHRFRFVCLHTDEAGKVKEIEYQKADESGVLMDSVCRASGAKYVPENFHRLIWRVGQKKPWPFSAPEPEAKPKAEKGVLDGDIWSFANGDKFIVIRVHQEVAFCQFLGSKGHFILDLDSENFGKLLERNGRPYQAKRSQPQRGMDLATYGIHKGDKWQTLAGCKFTVIVPKDDGKGRIQSVIIEDENGSRADLAELSLDFFHYLLARDGKNMEEA